MIPRLPISACPWKRETPRQRLFGPGSARRARRSHVCGPALALVGLLACDSGRPVGPDPMSRALLNSYAVSFTDNDVTPFGTFNGIPYVRYTGRFEGTTSLGDFRMPYEIIAPADPGDGNGAVLVEPPHFSFGPLGRELVLGRELLFGGGFSYAAVGFGSNGLNILDPSAANAIIKGALISDPGTIKFGEAPDEEILIQFVKALTSEPFAVAALGAVDWRYAYGASQTAGALLETLHAPGGPGLFDLTLLHIAMWRPPFAPAEFQRIHGEFAPLSGVGRVVFVESEGDQIASDAEQFRRAAHLPDYRVYEVAGAAHLPGLRNPLDHLAVMRAIFVAADRWVRSGIEPPPSNLMNQAPPGEIDPVYGFASGIARDGDLNALGGVRLPDLHVGRAQFIALDVSLPGLPINGTSIDLACAPPAGIVGDEPRFRNHGQYVSVIARQVKHLQSAGFLLPQDAEAIKQDASASNVGKPGSCSD